jgi:hypothetical protein
VTHLKITATIRAEWQNYFHLFPVGFGVTYFLFSSEEAVFLLFFLGFLPFVTLGMD